jgi:hypothetical protein
MCEDKIDRFHFENERKKIFLIQKHNSLFNQFSKRAKRLIQKQFLISKFFYQTQSPIFFRKSKAVLILGKPERVYTLIANSI